MCLKFCEFEGRICVGRVHETQISNFIDMPDNPTGYKTLCLQGSGMLGFYLDVNCETCSVNIILILSTGVLQPQGGMEEFKQGKSCFLTSCY